MITNANDSIHNSEQGVQDGLTKREYFAAMAMQGIASGKKSPAWYERDTATKWQNLMAKEAVLLADALIEALNKKQTT